MNVYNPVAIALIGFAAISFYLWLWLSARSRQKGMTAAIDMLWNTPVVKLLRIAQAASVVIVAALFGFAMKDRPEDRLEKRQLLISLAFGRISAAADAHGNVGQYEAIEYLRSLDGLDFRGIDFSEAYLRGVDLAGEDLYRANFQDAVVSSSDFRNANLEEANLRGADFRYSNFQGARFANANLQDANLSGARCLTVDQLENSITDRKTKIPDLPSDCDKESGE